MATCGLPVYVHATGDFFIFFIFRITIIPGGDMYTFSLLYIYFQTIIII